MELVQQFSSGLPRPLRRPAARLSAILLLQIALAFTSGLSAFLLHFDFAVPHREAACLIWGLLTWVIVKPVCVHIFGGTKGAWRYFSTPDLLQIAAGSFASFAVSSTMLILLCPVPFPRAVLIVDALIGFLLTTGVRGFTRIYYETSSKRRSLGRERTLIYGAGQAGVLLLQEARQNPSFPHDLCGFIDDLKHKGLRVQGVRVLGKGSDLKRLVAEHNITEVLIAIPSATAAEMNRIMTHCKAAGLKPKTMPSISEILSGKELTTQIRDVAVEDVLGRSSVRLDDDKIRMKIHGKVVLVSGAAGSIGSEICRQVARYQPAALVALEISETALFFLEREMNDNFPNVHFCPEIGSIQNIQRLREVLGTHLPSLVLHAAAYKHVPLMEKHFFEAVENNVFGTHNLATVSAEYGVQDFVMISSDKAVNPTNVMGATKRVAELLIRSFPRGGPRYVSVRFGNVLGSNGSVVPIFKKQIAAGGPVKVTHPDMERYFMTIPEASQLVLQACTMGRGGEIFVLDMGKPVKIVDLAKQLIQLSGLEPDKDIRIEFTGLRPGEKMFEELNMADEDMLPTHHQKIKVFAGNSLEGDEMELHLQRLRRACEQRNPKALVRELKSIVPDYTASKDVMERAFTDNLVTLGRVLHFTPVPGEAQPVSAGGQRRHR